MFAITWFAATLDTAGVANRKQSRSKYGAKRPKGGAAAKARVGDESNTCTQTQSRNREILPDPVYNSTLAEKFVNSMMWDGKKPPRRRSSTARWI